MHDCLVHSPKHLPPPGAHRNAAAPPAGCALRALGAPETTSPGPASARGHAPTASDQTLPRKAPPTKALPRPPSPQIKRKDTWRMKTCHLTFQLDGSAGQMRKPRQEKVSHCPGSPKDRAGFELLACFSVSSRIFPELRSPRGPAHPQASRMLRDPSEPQFPVCASYVQRWELDHLFVQVLPDSTGPQESLVAGCSLASSEWGPWGEVLRCVHCYPNCSHDPPHTHQCLAPG